MQIIERIRGAFDDLMFDLDLTAYGKSVSDIEDIFFSVKSELTDADDSLLLKTLGGGEIIVVGSGSTAEIAVQWDFDEYDGFVVGESYRVGLFLKFTGDPAADENVDETFRLKISQDFLQSN